jgi:hypothetical protein
MIADTPTGAWCRPGPSLASLAPPFPTSLLAGFPTPWSPQGCEGPSVQTASLELVGHTTGPALTADSTLGICPKGSCLFCTCSSHLTSHVSGVGTPIFHRSSLSMKTLYFIPKSHAREVLVMPTAQ